MHVLQNVAKGLSISEGNQMDLLENGYKIVRLGPPTKEDLGPMFLGLSVSPSVHPSVHQSVTNPVTKTATKNMLSFQGLLKMLLQKVSHNIRVGEWVGG